MTDMYGMILNDHKGESERQTTNQRQRDRENRETKVVIESQGVRKIQRDMLKEKENGTEK